MAHKLAMLKEFIGILSLQIETLTSAISSLILVMSTNNQSCTENELTD